MEFLIEEESPVSSRDLIHRFHVNGVCVNIVFINSEASCDNGVG